MRGAVEVADSYQRCGSVERAALSLLIQALLDFLAWEVVGHELDVAPGQALLNPLSDRNAQRIFSRRRAILSRVDDHDTHAPLEQDLTAFRERVIVGTQEARQ